MFTVLHRVFSGIRYFPILDELCFFIQKRAQAYTVRMIRKKAHIHPSAKIGRHVLCDKNVFIDEGTYCGSNCQFFAGENSKVVIGKYCAIGHNVHIKARTHHLDKTTRTADSPNIRFEKDIVIGNNVWIGDNAFIKQGVNIGDGSVVGANSVVTRDIEAYGVYAGAPARKIKNRSKGKQ